VYVWHNYSLFPNGPLLSSEAEHEIVGLNAPNPGKLEYISAGLV
jgi:hypothetical protein